MNRKKILSLAAGILAISLAAGCGSQAGKTGTEKVFTYGTMAYGPAMEVTGTDPHNSYDGWACIRYGVGETLFKFNKNMELTPWLAESFEQLDDETMRIVIRDNAVFSNGKKVTGAAVKACLEDLLKRHDRAPGDLKISAIEADGQTVTIHSSEKMPALLNYLSDPYGCIIDAEAGIKDGIAVGTGPYKAVKVTDTQLELEKNENYWGEVKPQMEKIIVKSIPDGDTLTMAMQNGELDAAQGLPYASLDIFKKNPSSFKLSQTETSRVYQGAFNFRTPELQDLRIRKAISMAVDKNNFSLVLLNDNGKPAIGPFPDNLSFGGKAVHTAAYDLDGARALLKDAGYVDTNGDGYVDKNGNNLELRYLTYTSRQELPLLAEALQENLRKIGIKLQVNATDNYKAFLRKGEYDIFAKAVVTAPTGDPEYYFTSHILEGAVDNAGFYASPQITQLERQLHNTYGAAERSRIAIQMEQQLLDDCALFYAAHLRMSFVMKRGIEGFSAHPSDYYEIRPELSKE